MYENSKYGIKESVTYPNERHDWKYDFSGFPQHIMPNMSGPELSRPSPRSPPKKEERRFLGVSRALQLAGGDPPIPRPPRPLRRREDGGWTDPAVYIARCVWVVCRRRYGDGGAAGEAFWRWWSSPLPSASPWADLPSLARPLLPGVAACLPRAGDRGGGGGSCSWGPGFPADVRGGAFGQNLRKSAGGFFSLCGDLGGRGGRRVEAGGDGGLAAPRSRFRSASRSRCLRRVASAAAQQGWSTALLRCVVCVVVLSSSSSVSSSPVFVRVCAVLL